MEDLELINHTAEQVMELLRPDEDHDIAVVQNGMALYFQDAVDAARVEKDIITAEVYDLVIHKVSMHMLFPQLWSCTCGSDFICRHEMAVFFSFYSEMGSVMDWVEEWKTSLRRRSSPVLPIKRASEVFAKKQEEVVLEQSYASYKEFVASTFSERIESELHAPAYMLEGHLQKYLNYIGTKEPIEREWK